MAGKRLKTAEPPLSPNFIPIELRNIPRWICWDFVDYGDGKKPRKVPIVAGGDYGCNYNDPSAWRTFIAVMKEATDRGGLGVGFVFHDSDRVVGVDLDNCYDDQGWLKPWGRDICNKFEGAFCETTPSGLGLHFIGLADPVDGRTRVELPNDNGGIERYSENRWFTFTGNPAREGGLVDISAAMLWLENQFFGRSSRQQGTAATYDSDVELDIELAKVCLEHIGRSRVANGDDWRAVGYACKGTSESLRDDWIKWSAQWSEFSFDECNDRWSRFDSRSGVGTLVYMATCDSGCSSKTLRQEAADRLGRVNEPAEKDLTPTLGDAIAEWLEQDEAPVLKTGMPSVDDLFGGGLPLGQMTALAAAPGVGKSALALHLCLKVLANNPAMTCTWCLGEMTMTALASRAIANYGDGSVELSAVLEKQGDSREIAAALAESVGSRFKIVKAPLIIDRIEQAIAKDKPQLLIVDYLQLVRTGRNLPDKTGEINECLVRLRELTMVHEMSTVVVTNVAKGVTEDTDIGNIGKGSNQIDFDCDNLLYGHRIDEKSDDGGQLLGWKCKKLRQGQMQDLKLWFYGHWQCFEDPQEMIETDSGHVREVEVWPEFEADRA